MKSKKCVELGTGDRISWRSGSSIFTGIVQAAVPPQTTNEIIRRMLDPGLPEYLVNLGRDSSKEIRVVVSITHKEVEGGWKPYDKARVKAVTAPTLSAQLLLYRKPKQRKDRKPDGADVTWQVTEVETNYSAKVEKGTNDDPLDFSNFEPTDDDDVFIAGLD